MNRLTNEDITLQFHVQYTQPSTSLVLSVAIFLPDLGLVSANVDAHISRALAMLLVISPICHVLVIFLVCH